MFLIRISIKKESGQAVFFVFYYFLLHAFFTHYYIPLGICWSSSKGQTLIKRNIRY